MRTTAVAVWAELLARPRGNVRQNARDQTSEVLGVLGDPHRVLPVIHVAGTNGKTTTARAIDALLSAAGLRVARFTSPHLHSPAERITLAGGPLSETELVTSYRMLSRTLQHLDDKADRPLPFFTALTALALTAFAQGRPDVAVIEVGIGGRDDATNVVDGDVAVICRVALDHRARLGHSLATIAAHKAGIIKPGARVVMAPQEPSVEVIVRDHAARRGATVIPVDRELQLLEHHMLPHGQRLSLRGYGDRHTGLSLPLLGAHQALNAMTAIVAAQEFLASRGETLDRDAIRQGLSRLTAPGCLEQVADDPPVIVDASDNPAGMVITARALRHAFGARRPTTVFAAGVDKDATAMLAALAPVTDEVILSSGGARCWDPHRLAPVAGELWERVLVIEHLGEAIEQARANAPGVLITGGISAASAARDLLRPARRAPVGNYERRGK